MKRVRARALGSYGAAMSFVLFALGGCDEDTTKRADAGARAGSSPDARAAPSADSAAEPGPDAADDASADASTASRGDCASAEPIAETELQGQASGSSVYGRVIGGEAGQYDPNGETNCGLAGVRVCLSESGACTESDRAGQFVLNGLPQDSAGQVTFEATGFRSMLRLVELTGVPINLFETRTLTQTSLTRLLERAGVENDPKLAAVVAVGLSAGEAIGGVVVAGDVSAVLEPGGVAPLYSIGEVDGSEVSDELDPSLSASREGGWGLFVKQQPGEYTVHFERDGVQCAPFVAGYGHGTDERGDIKAVLRGGFTTLVAAFCP